MLAINAFAVHKDIENSTLAEVQIDRLKRSKLRMVVKIGHDALGQTGRFMNVVSLEAEVDIDNHAINIPASDSLMR